MADHSMYHNLGQGELIDPSDPRRRTTQPAVAPFYPQQQQNHPPIAPSPYLQPQQQGMRYGSPSPSQGGSSYFGGGPPVPGTPPVPGPGPYGAPALPLPSPSPSPSHGQEYYGQQPQQGPSQDLTSHMNAMSLDSADPNSAAGARRKKKDRHAYHSIEPSGSSQAFNGMPPPGTPTAAAFLNADMVNYAPGFANPAAPSQSSQFPVAANRAFSPSFPDQGVPGAAIPAAAGSNQVPPNDMPSIPASREALQPHYLANVYPTFERHVPPPATVSYVALDQGNSSPKYARLTVNNIPATSEAMTSTGLPLGLLLQPLAPLAPGDPEIPVLDFGESGPPRCRRCRAYINPFMMFRSGGSKFVCNLCTYPNDTPSEYFAATTPDGARVDREQRPELMRGTVEFVVPREYWTREPAGMRWLFAIDVTQEAYNRGFLEAFCDGILAALYEGVVDEKDAPPPATDGGGAEEEDTEKSSVGLKRRLPKGAKVGFLTYDHEIHFYSVKAGLESAQMMIMPDLEDPFVPLSEGLFVDPYESKAVITSLLTRLPAMFSEVKNPEPALLATLNASLAALEPTGGKVMCSLAALSTWGPGRLYMRDDGKHPGGEPDKKLFTTDLPGWKKLTEKMASSGIGVDFFLAAPGGGYLDIATVGHVSATTGGETFYYPNFIAPRDSPKLSLEVKHAVTRDSGFQALMKVRCSNGLQISAYHGSFVQHTFGADLEIGVVDADKAIGVTFSYDGKLDSKLDAHFQSALLYTTVSGQRRVRCCNVIASVSDSARDALRFIDQDAVVSILAKEAATKLLSTAATLRETRSFLRERTIDVMACYRRSFVSQDSPMGQLVMPERLKEFCMYMLCLAKTRAFKGGPEPTDRRVNEARAVRTMGALELSLYLYPRMLPLHNLQPEEGFADPETGQLRMPPALRTSFSRVEPGGVYLVDNGQQCLLWMHAQTSPNLIQDLFGERHTTLASLDPYTSLLPVLETHLNAQVRNMIEFLRGVRGSKGLTVQLARQGIDGAEYEFARMLVEDRNNDAQSYVDWLLDVHKSVHLELSGQRKREDGDGGTDKSILDGFSGLRQTYW